MAEEDFVDDAAIAADGDVDFYKVVNQDADIRHNAEDLLNTFEHEMVAMVDTLQTLGVDPLQACSFSTSLVKDKARCEKLFSKLSRASSFVGAVTGNRPTFIEVYGRGGFG